MFDQQQNADHFHSETPLLPSYEPEEIIGRDEEIDTIAEAMKPLARRRKPTNLLVYGPAGVGKSCCVNHVIDALEDQTRAKAVRINCWQYSTRPALLTEMLIQLGYPAPRKGKPVDELLSKLREWLDKNRNVAVVLDEFDQLEERTELIYDLSMISKDAENHLGLIMIANQPPEKIDMDPRSESRIGVGSLCFDTYSEDKLLDILQERANKSFKPGRVSAEALERIAEYTVERGEDCRQALQYLLEAGRCASAQGQGKVTEKIVKAHIDVENAGE